MMATVQVSEHDSSQASPMHYYQQLINRVSHAEQRHEVSRQCSEYVDAVQQREKERIHQLLRKQEAPSLQRDKEGVLISHYAQPQQPRHHSSPIVVLKEASTCAAKEPEPVVTPPPSIVNERAQPSIQIPISTSDHNAESLVSVYCCEAPPPAYIKGRLPVYANLPVRVQSVQSVSDTESTHTMHSKNTDLPAIYSSDQHSGNSIYAWNENAAPSLHLAEEIDQDLEQDQSFVDQDETEDYPVGYRLYDYTSAEALACRQARQNAHVGEYSVYDDVGLRSSQPSFIYDSKTAAPSVAPPMRSLVPPHGSNFSIYCSPELDDITTISSQSQQPHERASHQHADPPMETPVIVPKDAWNNFRQNLLQIGEEHRQDMQSKQSNHALLNYLAKQNVIARTISQTAMPDAYQPREMVRSMRLDRLCDLPESGQLVGTEHSTGKKKHQHHTAACKKSQLRLAASSGYIA